MRATEWIRRSRPETLGRLATRGDATNLQTMSVAPMSLEQAGIIDFVAHDPSGVVVLVMVEGRDWDGSNERLFQLQEKINNYASFASDGQLSKEYPDLAGKPVRLELRCVGQPDPKTASFLARVREKLEAAGLAFGVKRISQNPSG